MAKSIRSKKVKRSLARNKRIKHASGKNRTKLYISIYFVSLLLGLFLLNVGSKFVQSSNTNLLCANSRTCQSDLTMKVDNGALGVFEGQKVKPPQVDSNLTNLGQSVLGDSVPSGEKHIYVDLSTETLYAYQGTTQVMHTPISSGRWAPTPVGNFHVWEKLLSTRMAGGEGADAYDLPNVTFVMYFYHDFGLHTAYWHDNFGHTMSHGCVNMRQVDSKALYSWADGPTDGHPGTPVSVCESFSAPNNCGQTNPLSS